MYDALDRYLPCKDEFNAASPLISTYYWYDSFSMLFLQVIRNRTLHRSAEKQSSSRVRLFLHHIAHLLPLHGVCILE